MFVYGFYIVSTSRSHSVLCLFLLSVEDQKEVLSPVNPELRHKEVQMNFFNQLTSVFNPDLTVLASPSGRTQVSVMG